MRSFQIIILIIFLIFFMITSYGTYNNLKTIIATRTKKILKILILSVHLLMLLVFIYLYIYPNQPRNATNYSVYLIFNFMLFALFIFNLPNSFAYLLHVIFNRRKAPVIPYAGLILSISILLSMVYGTVAGVHQTKTEHHVLFYRNLPEQFDGYKIFLFTDAHLGGMLFPKPLFTEAIKVVNHYNPDLVLFAGDLVNNFAYEVNGLEDYFHEITRNRDSFSILGNHDYGDYSDWENTEAKKANFQGILDANNKVGLRLLRNEHTVLKRGKDSIYLAGVENWGHPPFPQYANLDSAMQQIPPEAFVVLLTHDPAHWESKIKNERTIELTLSGHTHGMQWGIKLAGIPFSLAYFSRKYWGGLYRSENSVLYVNTGFGTVGVPWRLDMPAEFTIFTLKRGKIN